MNKDQAKRLAAAFETCMYYASAASVVGSAGVQRFRTGAIKELATALEEAFPESGGFILERPETRRGQKRQPEGHERTLGPTP